MERDLQMMSDIVLKCNIKTHSIWFIYLVKTIENDNIFFQFRVTGLMDSLTIVASMGCS